LAISYTVEGTRQGPLEEPEPVEEPELTEEPEAIEQPEPISDLELIELFSADLVAAWDSLDTTFLLDRLHPAVFERYSEKACLSHLENSVGYSEITVVALGDFGAWDWVVDDVVITINDTHAVEVELILTNGIELATELHYALVDGELRWFTMCEPPSQ
jgi:hypothetical protein